MRLIDRERIEGTRITIGKRVYMRDGQTHVCETYSAEYRDDSGRQVSQSLDTSNKTAARRAAMAIHARMERGEARPADSRITVAELIQRYMELVAARGLAPKSESKYKSDLEKLQSYCDENKIALAPRFGRDAFLHYRKWLVKQQYADKTVYGALILCKQLFKWAYQEALVPEYRIGAVKIAKARAKPQPCFTTDQVEGLLARIEGVELAVYATLAYAGLRVGEAIQLHWQDVLLDRGELGMFHIRLGGSTGTTKDKDHRFIPIHPRVRPFIESLPRRGLLVFPGITERALLKRLKELCAQAGFDNAGQYKLHSFRHHFASLCANHQVAYRKALSWLGHSSSDILELYYHLTDSDSQESMKILAADTLKIQQEQAER